MLAGTLAGTPRWQARAASLARSILIAAARSQAPRQVYSQARLPVLCFADSLADLVLPTGSNVLQLCGRLAGGQAVDSGDLGQGRDAGRALPPATVT